MKFLNPKTRLPLLVCLAVVLAWFSPWWLGGKSLAPLDLQNRMMSPWRVDGETRFAKNHIVSDCVDQYLVYRLIAEKSYQDEGWVGWSSLTYGGTAQYANTMALYYDWTMQLHRWFDFWTAWHLGLLGQVLIAAWGMLWFLRRRGIGALWACCGALAYAANSQFVTWIYHRWSLGAFCWVPWILWAIDGHRRGKRFSWPMVPLFIGMAFLGGTLQHAALVALAVAAIWGEEVIQTWHQPKSQPRLFGRYAAWGILGAGLAAMMFIPCVDALVTSNRHGLHTGLHGNAGNGIYPQGWLQPLFNLAAYPLQIFPSVLGRCDSVDVLKLFKSELFYVAYFGSLPVLAAFLSLRRKESPPLARLLVFSGLVLPLTPLVRVLYQRLFLLFILGGIFAFVHLMETAGRETRLRIFRITGTLAATAIAAWSVLSVVLHSKTDLLAAIQSKIVAAGGGSSFGYFSVWIAERADRFTGDLMIWSPQQWMPLILFAAGLAGLRCSAALTPRTRTAGAWLVALAVVAEVSLFGSRWVVWADKTNTPLFPETPEVTALREHVGRDGRTTTMGHPTAHMALTPFVPNTLAAYGIAAIGGYDSIIPECMLLPNEAVDQAARVGRCGVSHLITWTGNAAVPREWKPVWQSRSMSLYENPLMVPRYAGFRTDSSRDGFFTGDVVELLAIRETSGMENTRSLEVPAGVHSIRIAENHASGWQYRTAPGNDWQPVLRAADSSMLLEIGNSSKPGKVEMRYHPPLRTIGFWVSGISLLLVLAGVPMSAGARRNPDAKLGGCS